MDDSAIELIKAMKPVLIDEIIEASDKITFDASNHICVITFNSLLYSLLTSRDYIKLTMRNNEQKFILDYDFTEQGSYYKIEVCEFESA